MKNKKLLYTFLIGSLAIGLVACGNKNDEAATQKEATDLIQNVQEIELEVASPTTDITDQSIEQLPWTQLGDLDTHPELREAMETYLNITVDADGTKHGQIYYNAATETDDQNATLETAMENWQFKYVFSNPEAGMELSAIAAEYYTDVDLEDTDSAYAVVNAYFELLPDANSETKEFNGDATLTRAEAMALLMRATTPVNESGIPETNEAFTSAVGQTVYTDFAAPMNQYSYLNLDNGLTDHQFASTMTKGEYIYMTYNAVMRDCSQEIPQAELTVISDGGNITLADAIQNPESVPHDMYEVFAKAASLNMVSEDDLEDWSDPLTKTEAIKMFIAFEIFEMHDVDYSSTGYVTDEQTGGTYYDPSLDTRENSPEKNIQHSYDWMHENCYKVAGYDDLIAFLDDYAPQGGYDEAWDAYAQSQGADQAIGSWWYYYSTGAAKGGKSYAINQETGERVEAGPIATVGDGIWFWGKGEERDRNGEDYYMNYQEDYPSYGFH